MFSFNPFNAKPIFSRKKKKFFRKFYSYFSFYARAINLESFFFIQLIELFHGIIKKKIIIINKASYETFRPKPLTLTLFT